MLSYGLSRRVEAYGRQNLCGRTFNLDYGAGVQATTTLSNETANDASLTGASFILEMPIEAAGHSLVFMMPGVGSATYASALGERAMPNDVSWKLAVEVPTGYSGTVTTGGSKTVVTDSAQNFFTNQLSSSGTYILRFYGTAVSGSNISHFTTIASNTATAITLTTALIANTAVGDKFEIFELVPVQFQGVRTGLCKAGTPCIYSDPLGVPLRTGVGSGSMFVRMFVSGSAGFLWPACQGFHSQQTESWNKHALRDASAMNRATNKYVDYTDSPDIASWGDATAIAGANYPAHALPTGMYLPAPVAVLGMVN